MGARAVLVSSLAKIPPREDTSTKLAWQGRGFPSVLDRVQHTPFPTCCPDAHHLVALVFLGSEDALDDR